MKMSLKDGEREWVWSIQPAAIPRAGDTVWIAQAPIGVIHIVRSVQHRFDAGEQSITVLLDRLHDPNNL